MPSRCCVVNCNSNYDSDIKETGNTYPVFSFPALNDPDRSREEWFDSLPNVITDTPGKKICIRHWPENFETINRKGHQVPKKPPSIWPVPNSCCRQTLSKPRNASQRGVDSESRQKNAEKRRLADQENADIISDFNALEEHCRSLDDLLFKKRDDHILLVEFSDDIPPTHIFSIIIHENFSVDCFKSNYRVPVRSLLGFSARLEKYSQLRAIIDYVRKYFIDPTDSAVMFGTQLEELLENNTDDDDELQRRILFLCEQLQMLSTDSKGNRYSKTPVTFRTALTLFLRSRNCYNELRKTLNLPHPKTIKSSFGKLGTPGTDEECRKTIEKVFATLEGNQLFIKIMVDEIHVQASIRYRGHHLIGHSVDNPNKAAKTVLGLMLESLFGGPSFMARLLPVFSLDGELLFDQIKKLIKIIHDAGGFVFLVMCDDLRANQKAFSLFREEFGAHDVFAVKHPIENPNFDILYLLHDPTHLFKNIRNNWVTEKMKTIDFKEPFTREVFPARWSDLVSIYKSEASLPIKSTKLSYATLYPTNFEKQKVSLAVNVFNEKTVAVLAEKKTGNMVRNVTKMWNILNVKTTSAGRRLNDPDREPITDANDARLSFLVEIAQCFNEMKSTYTHRVRSLTDDTSNALFLTLTGLVHLTKMFLEKFKFDYVLLGQFQSDPIEGAFGGFRQGSGGNYHISYEQILSSMTLQRLKLFDILELPYSNEHTRDSCCSTELCDNEIDLLDVIPSLEDLEEIERSTLYYICGYVSMKINIGLDAPVVDSNISEFTTNVSRGALKHPPEELFDLGLRLYCYHKNVESKSCSTRLMKAFKEIYESSYSFLDESIVSGMLQRFINCFSKGHANMQTEQIKIDKNNRKKRKALQYQ